jgi:hypothetical protein
MQVKRVVEEVRAFKGLSDRVRSERVRLGLSIAAASKQCGLSRPSWYLLESEEGTVTEEMIRRVEAGLSVNLGVNFDRDRGQKRI